MKGRLIAGFLAVWMILSLSACGENADKGNEDDNASVGESEPLPEPEVPEPVFLNPLTGLPMETEHEKKRPVAVMFNNLKAAQPQLGVSQADIIYEIPAEGGITRMIGVYQTLDGVGNLGSIRSTRPYYLEVALGHDALLVHAGGSPEAYQDIRNWGVDNMDGVNGGSDAKIFWRDRERKKRAGYEHSLLTSGEKVLEYLNADHFRTEHKDSYQYVQKFAEDGTPTNGTPAKQMKLYYTNYKTGVFVYDAETQQYQISQYGDPYTDGNNGEQVSVTNVIMLETDIYPISGDTAGRLRVRMTGNGQGTYFCGGQSVPIQWSKADRNSQFVYWLSDGTPLSLGEGTSYVCIMDPRSSRLEIS